MPTRQQIKDQLTEKEAIVDMQIFNVSGNIHGIIDVNREEIINPDVFCEELNELVQVRDHGKPVRQRKLSNPLSATQTETYDCTVHRYEFVSQKQEQ